MHQLMLQMQQVQRQYNQICQDMLNLQNTIGQMANQLQQEAVQSPMRQSPYAATPGNTIQPYTPGAAYGSSYTRTTSVGMGDIRNQTQPSTSPYGNARASVSANGPVSAKKPINTGAMSSVLHGASKSGLSSTATVSSQSLLSGIGRTGGGPVSTVGRQSELSTYGRSI